MKKTTSWHDLLHPGDARDFFSRRTFPAFDPTASAYHGGNALWLAELSRVVYRRDVEEEGSPLQPTRTSILAKAGFRQRNFFVSKKTDTQAMLIESIAPPVFAVLVFRGTEQKRKDFAKDFEIGVPPLSQGTPEVHKGFKDALDSIWHDVNAALSTLDCPVFYTGHSLGAALATLAAARRPPSAVYTFGSPRTGNEAFAASLQGVPIYRIVDDEDVVTTLPPKVLGFKHAGEAHVLTDPSANASRGLIDWFLSFFRPPKPLADHAPINYVDRVGY
jgi:triacylglycerol lipase